MVVGCATGSSPPHSPADVRLIVSMTSRAARGKGWAGGDDRLLTLQARGCLARMRRGDERGCQPPSAQL